MKYAEILSNHHKNRDTGALFLISTKGALLQAYFDKGNIIAARCGSNKGEDAIKQFAANIIKQQRFHPRVKPRERQEDLPNTVDLIRGLDKKSQALKNNSNSASREAQEKVILEQFTNALGPIAELLFKEELSKASTLTGLLDRLEQHLSSKREARIFRQGVQRQLSA
jgi:hypothetical protein